MRALSGSGQVVASFDIAIIGGGAIGLTVAYELRQRLGSSGRIVLLDAGEPGRESSWAGAGMIPPADPTPVHPLMNDLARCSSQRWPALSAELRELTGLDNGYRLSGAVHLHQDRPSAERSALSWNNVGVQALGLDQLTNNPRWPPLDWDPHAACFLPAQAQVRNPRHLKALQIALTRQDQLLSGHAVHQFQIDADRVQGVHTHSGTIYAERFLIAAGCWTSNLLNSLPERHRWRHATPGGDAIQPMRGQIALLNHLPARNWPIIEQGPRYLVPRDDGHLLVGSTEELVGFNKHSTASGVRDLLEFAIRTVPELRQATLERTWAGLRPFAPRGMPFLGRWPTLNNVWIAAGHHRAGLSLSAATGLLMAEQMLELPPTLDLSALAPQLDSTLTKLEGTFPR